MMETYTAGMTPAEALRGAMSRELGESPYEMSLVGEDALTVQSAVNQGIDSHLEACYVPDRGDSYEPTGHRLECEVSQESLPVLLRRLWEMFEDGAEDAYQLRSSILYTLGIEEV